jgi:UDP-glucose 4-epimerase
MTILVTGGAGYVGSHTVHYLIEQGYDVVVFDNLSAGYRAAVHDKAAFVQGDLLDPAAIQRVFKAHDFDGIIHFASHIQVGESMQKPWLYLRDNVLAAGNLLEAAAQHDIKRVVFSSTAALFDKPETMPIRADNPITPGSPYGESKAIIERYLHWMDELYGMKSAALRYFNAAGAHPDGIIGEAHQPETHLIPITLQVALGQREKLIIFGEDYDTPDGTCIRDYVHVLDLASAHVLALEALKQGQSLRYNLGTGNGYSIREVLETARRVTGKVIPHESGKRRPGDLPVLVADSSTIREALGWQPQYDTLESIIETAWRWHRAHPNGYDNT